MSLKCQNCQTENLNNALFCKECGGKLSQNSSNEKNTIKKEKNIYKILFFSILILILIGVGLYFSNNKTDVASEKNMTIVDESNTTVVLGSEEIFNKAKKSIVTVIASGLDGVMQGSGVAVSQNKILTNCHVIDNANNVKVLFENSEYKVDSIYGNNDFDYCILTVSNLPARSANISDTNITIGQKVYSIGTPKGFELTIADGLVSGLRKVENISIIQTTAPISHGSSGGGLFNERGQLVGITTMMLKDAQNINFAIPADLNKTIKLNKIETKVDIAKFLEQNTILTQENIKYFLETYLKANCFQSINDVDMFFSIDLSKYFNFANPSHFVIFNENVAYCQRWASMEYDLKDFKIQNARVNGNVKEVDLIADIGYFVSNDIKSIRGDSIFLITLVDEFGNLKIKSISEIKNTKSINKNYINPNQDRLARYAYEMITGESIFNPSDIKIIINSKNKKIYCVSNICKTEDEVIEYINNKALD